MGINESKPTLPNTPAEGQQRPMYDHALVSEMRGTGLLIMPSPLLPTQSLECSDSALNFCFKKVLFQWSVNRSKSYYKRYLSLS